MKITQLLLTSSSLAHLAGAATLANWKELNPNAAVVPITGADTDSPVFGNGTTANSAQAAWIAGQFGTTASPESVNLAIGDTLTVSGSMTLTGGTNNDSQFRFGVYNSGGQLAVDNGSNWSSGLLHVIGTTSDLFQARTDGPFISTTTSPGGNAVDLDSVITRTGTFNGDSTIPFLFSMAITRNSATTVDVVSLITGGDGNYSEQYVEEGHAPTNFTYDSVGVLFGGSAGLEQASFSGVQYQVTSIPEPSATLLGLTGLLFGFARRRR
ncbi:MAG: hypothetical protein QNL33_01535 [Akkermansiaceae bacterium]|jgi:hypothetical protein